MSYRGEDMDDTDDEELVDEDEEEYVYKRGEAKKADLDALVARNHTQHATAPAAADKGHALPFDAPEVIPPQVNILRSELAAISYLEGVTFVYQASGATITLAGKARRGGVPVIALDARISADYPKSAPSIGVLPRQCKDLSPPDLHELSFLIVELMDNHKGGGVVAKVTKELHRWMAEPTVRQELQQRVERAALARQQEEQRKEEARLAEELRLEQARTLRWAPLTPEEDSQRLNMLLSAPCKVISNLSLPRHYHLSGARVGARLYLFGGVVQGHSQPSNTLYILHTASRHVEAHLQPNSGKVLWPHGLSGHASCAIGTSVYLFGGKSTANAPMTNRGRSPVWELNTRTLEWYRRGTMPQHMQHFTATPIDQRRVVLFGGEGGMTPTSLAPSRHNEVYVFDTVTANLTLVKVAGTPPPARYGHAAVCWQNKVVIYGGRGSSVLSDVWVLDTEQWKWHGPVATPDSGVPGRVHHSASLLGGQMVMYGGEYSDDRQLNDLLVYDIPTSRLFNIPLTADTEPRCGHVAFVTGGTLFVAGGARGQIDYIDRQQRRHQSMHPAATCIAVALVPAPVAVPSSTVVQTLDGLRRAASNTFADVLFGPQRRPAHAFVLRARCSALTGPLTLARPSLAAPIALTVAELKCADAAAAFLDYVYTGNPFASLARPDKEGQRYAPSVLIELSDAARALDLPSLQARVLSPPHPEEIFSSEVLHDLAQTVHHPLYTDFTLVAGALRLPMHRALLACRSEYFSRMLGSGMAEASRGELLLPAALSEGSVRAFHRFLFTDELDPECAEHVLELLPYSDQAQLTRLQRLVERLITDAYDLTDLDSLLALTALADEHRSSTLLSRCLFLIAQHFTLARAMKSEAWATLTPDLQRKAQRFGLGA